MGIFPGSDKLQEYQHVSGWQSIRQDGDIEAVRDFHLPRYILRIFVVPEECSFG